MNVRFLETFVWVARLRNFSAAAEKLNSTQAAVSNRIATLERELGVRLFERDLRTVRLTQQGKDALARAEDIVRRVADFSSSVGDSHAVRGAISIGTIDSLVYTWIPRLIDRLTTQYPHVNVELTVETSAHVARLLLDGEIDLAFIVGQVTAPDIWNEALCSYECLWVASPQLVFPDRPLLFADLAAYPLLAYSRGSLPHIAMQRLAAVAGIAADQLRIYNMNSIATQLRLVIDQMGVSALPHAVVRDSLARGEVRLLDTAVKMPPLSYYAVYGTRPSGHLKELVVRMAQELAA